MRRAGAVVALCLALVQIHLGLAAPAGARHTSGPVTIRGIASSVTVHSFVFRTSKGTFTVLLSSATQIEEKGKRGRLSVQNGDHVGVRGFLQGTVMRAMRVRIYPVKPKAYTAHATVASVHSGTVVVSVGGKLETVHLVRTTTYKQGRAATGVSALTPGVKVRLRLVTVSGITTAQSVYIYVTRVPVRHVELRGTITAVAPGTLTLTSGGRLYSISITRGTRVYLGSARTTQRALTAGREARVFACCVGHPLAATSVHLTSAPTTTKVLRLKGRVVAVAGNSVHVAGSSGTETIEFDKTTRFEIGSATVRGPNVRPGDAVSIHAVRRGSTLVATIIHVDAASRRPRTVVGRVVATGRGTVTVLSRGKRYTILSSGPVLLNGKPAHLGDLREGDHVHARGTLRGLVLLSASVAALRKPPVQKHLHGTIVQVSGRTLVVADAYGIHHQVRLAPSAAVHVHGAGTPAADLVAGADVSLTGTMSGPVLVATAMTITVHTVNVKGIVTWLGPHSLVLTRSSGTTVAVDLPAGVLVTDGTKHATLHLGAAVVLQGLREPSGRVRAGHIAIVHPTISVSGTALRRGGALLLLTAAGKTYVLRVPAHMSVDTGREQVTLTPNTIPPGAHLHVVGAVQNDGSVLVSTMTVRLKAVTVRGTVRALIGTTLTLSTVTGQVSAITGAQTEVEQGSHPLTLSDLVLGDDVTVYGYDGGQGTVLARKLDVHRKLVGMDGTVNAVSNGTFVLSAVDGPHTVLLSSVTVFTGGTVSDLAAGSAVHVTGYLRGDGSILATRVRVMKAK